MNPRTFQLHTTNLRGFPAILVVIVLGLILAAVVTAAVFVGLAVIATGVVVTSGAALYFAIRRKLNLGGAGMPGTMGPRVRDEDLPRQEAALTEVREIQVDEVIQREK